MSFVSQLLERLGVLQPAAGSDASPAADASPLASDAHEIPTLPPTAMSLTADPLEETTGEVTGDASALQADFRPPQVPFDPEQTVSSLDSFDDYTAEPEHTLVGGPPEVTEVTATPPPAAPRRTRSVRLQDLLAERGLPAGPDIGELGLDVDIALEQTFPDAFVEAGLHAPEHGWTVERVHKAIRQGRSVGLTPAQVRFQIEQTLVKDGASLRAIAADAAAKDEVLDELERRLQERVERRDERLAERAESLRRQILTLQAEREDVLAQAASDRNRFAGWREKKRRIEREWADVLDVLAPFV